MVWVIAAALLLTGSAASAAPAQKEEQSLEGMLKSIVTADGRPEADKVETVYVIAAPDGSADQVIVSEWLKNPGNADTLTDRTRLQNIENTNGYEAYTRDGDALTWVAGGSDIHYRGAADGDLPVKVHITYLLDGVATAPEAMAGKSGHVTLRFDYENLTGKTVAINGQDAGISVPFLMVSGLALSNKTFSNVTVSSGTVYNDGSRSIVLGYALPGLTKGLAMEETGYEIPESVIVEADTTDFSLAATLTVAVNGIFGNLTFDSTGLASWNDDLDALASAASQLADGVAQLSGGAGELLNGLTTISDNSASLNGGADAVFQSLTAAAQEQLNAALAAAGQSTAVSLTPDNCDDVLAGLLAAAETTAQSQASAAAEEKVRAAVTEQVTGQVTQQVTDAAIAQAQDQITEQVTAALKAKGYTGEQAAAYLQTEDGQAKIASQLEKQTASQEAQQAIAAVIGQQMASDAVQATIKAYTAQQMETDAVQTQIQAAVSAGLAGSDAYQAIVSLRDQLNAFAAFRNGLKAYTAGVDTACAGAQTLADGAGTLADTMRAFDTDGVEKLVSALRIDHAAILDRLQAVAQADREYQSFGGIAPDQSGSVKFIWRTDGI